MAQHNNTEGDLPMNRRNSLRILALALMLALMLPGLPAASAEAELPPIDLSEEVHLVGYIPGDPSRENDEMMKVLNAKLKEDINTTIEFKFLNWGEFFEKYPLILASGEVFDFAYIASWADFHAHAARGAFADITEMVKAYAPDVYRIADQAVWSATSYHGKVYGIPHDGLDISTAYGFVYREDLRKKYGVQELVTLEDLGDYIRAIKKNNPEMATAARDATNNNLMLRYGLRNLTSWAFDYYGLVYDREDPDARLYSKYETPEYRDGIQLMADWKNEGFWDTSVMVGQDFVNEVDQHPFSQGLSAFFGGQTGDYSNTIDFIKDFGLDWEAGFHWVKYPSGHIDKGDVLNDGVSISATSKHPERTLMAMNLILTQPEYKWLIGFGIPEKHYVIGEDGFPTLPPGITPDNAPYNYFMHAFSWFLYDRDSTFPQRQEKDAADLLEEEMNALANAPTLYGFYLDTADLATELAALNDIWIEYEMPLTWGFINESVEADIANLIAKQKAAGIDKVREEAQKQIDAFLGK